MVRNVAKLEKVSQAQSEDYLINFMQNLHQ